MEKAIELLRERGIAKAAKKSDRIAAEGLVLGYVSEDQKTGAVVCPYVVSGKYRMFNNKLKIEFLEPFKVGPKDSLEEKNNHLRNMMIKALAEANKED